MLAGEEKRKMTDPTGQSPSRAGFRIDAVLLDDLWAEPDRTSHELREKDATLHGG